MRITEILNEAINKKPLVLYHGSNSDAFDTFAPQSAAKGEQYWNPLGNGMYATNMERFASNFGDKVHKVIIPPGYKYLRINMNQWQTIGESLVMSSLKAAMKQCGQNYDHWENGEPIKPVFPKNREAIIDAIIVNFKKNSALTNEQEKQVRTKTEEWSTDKLLKYLKNNTQKSRQPKDETKSKKIWNFRYEVYRILGKTSPYEGLYETSALVDDFGEDIYRAYHDILPHMSDKKFQGYDFIIFTETNDVIGNWDDKKNRSVSSWEVVIFNKDLQKTQAQKTNWNRFE